MKKICITATNLYKLFHDLLPFQLPNVSYFWDYKRPGLPQSVQMASPYFQGNPC